MAQTESEATPKYAKKGSVQSRKQGTDRRIKQKSALYESNMDRKMEGKEVPKTRKTKKEDMPVSPLVLGICLFLVIGSAVFQLIQTSQSSQTVE